MAWKNVASYSFGFELADKQFWLNYTLEGELTTSQVFLDAEQFSAVARMFDSATSIGYDTDRNYFSSEPRMLLRTTLLPRVQVA